MLSTAFHILVILHHSYVGYHLLTQLDYGKSDDDYVHKVMKPFKWSYFTGWNFSVQSLYFLICLAEDLLRLKKHMNVPAVWVRQVKDFIFTSLFFPGTMFVSLMFWGFYLVDRELVFPKAADAVVPSWMNHSMHTVIVVALVIEMRITRHRYSKRSLGLAALALYITAYDIQFFHTFYSYGQWMYPIWRVLDSWSHRTLLFLTSTCVLFGFYVLGEHVSSKLVGFGLERINEKLHVS